MKFASVGAKIDGWFDKAGSSWRGSVAKKTIDEAMERSKEVAGKAGEKIGQTMDSVDLSAKNAKGNLKRGLDEVKKENPDSGFMKKAWEVGKRGGLLGMMMKKETAPKEGPGEEPKPLESTPNTQTGLPKEDIKNMPPQVDGWNISQ